MRTQKRPDRENLIITNIPKTHEVEEIHNNDDRPNCGARGVFNGIRCFSHIRGSSVYRT